MKILRNNQIMKLSRLVLTVFTVFLFSMNLSAQTCPTTLKSKTGKVYSANPATITTTATSNQVRIKIKKTAGRAETQVNIYINNVQQPNPIEYNNGTYIPSGWQTRTLNNVNGKTIKVKIVNQSVANTFSYSLKINGEKRSIASTGGPVDGILIGQQNKTIYTNGSCTAKTQIIVRRRSGNARGNIRVWEKRSNGTWVRLDQYNTTLEQNKSKKIFVVNSSRKLKIELRNVSVGNTLGYRMNALAKN
ncbi:MAG: hypothetical protein JKY22_08660 [Flavobacteriaceae bacterium]|nr:hypothetical protein [Flavobacteriaceae bacterium]